MFVRPPRTTRPQLRTTRPPEQKGFIGPVLGGSHWFMDLDQTSWVGND